VYSLILFLFSMDFLSEINLDDDDDDDDDDLLSLCHQVSHSSL